MLVALTIGQFTDWLVSRSEMIFWETKSVFSWACLGILWDLATIRLEKPVEPIKKVTFESGNKIEYPLPSVWHNLYSTITQRNLDGILKIVRESEFTFQDRQIESNCSSSRLAVLIWSVLSQPGWDAINNTSKMWRKITWWCLKKLNESMAGRMDAVIVC